MSPLIATLPVMPSPAVLKARLRRAVETDDLFAIKTLVARGADVNAQDADGSSPLSVALRMNSGSVFLTPPVPATLKALIDAGADINAQDREGNTALMRAVMNGNIEAVRVLLIAHARMDTRNKQGKTTLVLAKTSQNNGKSIREIVRLLIQAGAK